MLAENVFPAASHAAESAPKSLLTITANQPSPPPETGYLQLGSANAGRSPSGHVISVNSRYFLKDGKPWLPVMGELHFSRYPERYWEEQILKMKAGGIQIVSTYLFWIHHEEVEGEFDWTGRRDLRKFVELCARHGLLVYPRLGPWSHGEVRNGGLPDWVLKKGPTRENDPTYLSYVRRYYNQIGQQVKGLLWKDGGPIIGVQLENEYSKRGPNSGAAHIATLKTMAREAGFDVPLYTVTGWDNATYPAEQVIPVFGGYPAEFWTWNLDDGSPDPEGVYLFHVMPTSGESGIMQGVTEKNKDEIDLWHYPRATAELGGGMQVAYHRRPLILPQDIAPMALVQLGAGVNLLGYYMFQGGTNPDGKLSTMQESQETDYPSDLPVKSYDFQAPLREFGQMNGSFRPLKVIHQFVQDFGGDMAPMAATAPDLQPKDVLDESIPRVVARTQGERGFLFFNNYRRNDPLPEHKSVQIALQLPAETMLVPQRPFDLPAQSHFFWPVNMDLQGALLKYATAQPLTKLEDGKTTYYFFIAIPGITPEFVFAGSSVQAFSARSGKLSREGKYVSVAGIAPSLASAIQFRGQDGGAVHMVLLSEKQAEDAWKISLRGRDYLWVTEADLFADEQSVHLRARDTNQLSFAVFPADGAKWTSAAPLRKAGNDGLFARYATSVKPVSVSLQVEKVRDAAPALPVKLGKKLDWRPNPIASSPDDADFARAAVWKLTVPADALRGLSDLYLDIPYVGDVARLYQKDHLLGDDFYHDAAWEVGLKRFADKFSDSFELKILPLRKDAPIYLPKSAWPDFAGAPDITKLGKVTLHPEYEVVIHGDK
ncbi:MAG: beta-galactosidase [Acidobacteria bacterium]|nr:beta-galactosidase [Acidobacteriota bacterium]